MKIEMKKAGDKKKLAVSGSVSGSSLGSLGILTGRGTVLPSSPTCFPVSRPLNDSKSHVFFFTEKEL
jgi:hypothetical protein